MAIARDSELFAQTSASSPFTFAFNNVAGDALYVMGHDATGVPTILTGVTYAGVSMTKIAELPGNASFNDRAITLWRLVAPATGSNNIVVTAPGATNLRFDVVSYSGVHQSIPEDGTDTTTGTTVTSISTDITTGVADCWMLQFSKDQNGTRTYTNTTGDSIRYNTDAGGHLIVDTNSSFAAGLNTITDTMTSVTGIGALAVAIRPVASAVSSSSNFLLMGVG